MTAGPAIGWRPIKGWLGHNDFVPAATPELDRQRERRRTLVILLVAGLARLPFLWHGFGGHPDEWYTIRSGLDFWLHGTYYPSRPPLGNPLNEIMMGGLAWLAGAPACALASTFASLVTLAYMRALAPFYGIRDSFWPVVAFSFEPWFWSSGTHCLDYVWGTGSLVAALYYVERRQFAAAGLACAFGFGVAPPRCSGFFRSSFGSASSIVVGKEYCGSRSGQRFRHSFPP